MTFDEYIRNPSGKGSAVMTNRQMYDAMYTNKYNLIMLREGKKFNWKCYKTKDNSRYIIHIKVPSEVVPKFYYDVVLEFYTKEPSLIPSTTLAKYDFRAFSNSPDFMYTHCHAFVENDMFFKDLSSKMPKAAIKKPAVERNPQGTISYVKSLYFAYLIMKQFGLFQKTNYVMVDVYNKITLSGEVMPAEKKAELRQSMEAEIKEKERSQRLLEKRRQTESRNTQKTKGGVTNGERKSVYTKKTGTVGRINPTRRSNYIKKTKKI